MKLNFITGKEGSGKTRYLLNNFSKDEDNFMITTDTSVFYIERTMSQRGLPGKCIGINSFINFVMEEIGGIQEEVISEQMQIVFLSDIMIEHFRDLKSLRIVSYENNLVNEISGFINNCIMQDIKPEDLLTSKSSVGELTKNKLDDIVFIFNAYLDFLKSNEMLNSALLAKKMLKILNKSSSFRFKKIFIDALNFYDELTIQIIKTIINISDEVYLVFSTTSTKSYAYDIYKNSMDAFIDIDNYALEKGAVIERIKLKSDSEIKSGIQIIENELFNKDTDTKTEFKDVALHEASNLYKEIDFVASQIKMLLDAGYSFDDIIITGTDLSTYKNIINNSFNKNGILSYYYKNKSFNSTILFNFFKTLTDCVLDKVTAKRLLTLMDINYFNFSEEDKITMIDFFNRFGEDIEIALKNCQIYDNSGFLKVSVIFVELEKQIDSFKNHFEFCDNASDFIQEYYEYAEELGLENVFLHQYQDLSSEHPQLANEIAEMWNGFVSIVDEMSDLHDSIDFSKFVEIFYKIAKEKKLINSQEFCDEVKILDMKDAQNRKSKICFVIGCNEGKFPFNVTEGLFSDIELTSMNSLLNKNFLTTADTMTKQYAAIYSVLTLPSDKLFISWPSHDLESRNVRAANILNNVIKIFENNFIKEEKFYGNDKEELFFDLLNNLSEYRKTGRPQENLDDEYWELSTNPDYSERLEKAIQSAVVDKSKFNIADAAGCYVEKEFFGVTRIERFSQCPFKHFVEFGLMPRYQKTFEETAANKGNFYHIVLNNLFRYLNENDISTKTLDYSKFDKIITPIIDSAIANHNENILESNPSLKVEKMKMVRRVKQTAWQNILQLNKGDFKVMKTEFKIGRDISLKIKTKDGKEVSVIGVIDRIDEAEINSEKYVRIIDYKSGLASFSDEKVKLGLQLQLPLYMKAITGDYHVAGIYYSKITDAIKDADSNDDVSKKYQLNGLSNSDRAVLETQDYELCDDGVASKVIQADITTKGELSKKSKVLSEAEFMEFIDSAVEVASNAITEILEGKTDAEPKKTSDFNACDYCPYKALCHK